MALQKQAAMANRVLRAVASSDCGHMVNPDGISNQIEGGSIASWQMDNTRVFRAIGAAIPF